MQSADVPANDKSTSAHQDLAAVLAPALAALVALAAHGFLPDRQNLPIHSEPSPFWVHPYPLVLIVLLAASLLSAGIHFAFAAFRPSICHHAPLWAGAIVVVAFWDLVTQKTNWMRLPYFPGPDLVIRALADDWAILLESAVRSLVLLSSGYLIGVVMGITTGVLIGWFPHARYWGMPALKIVGPLPATALVPLAMTLSNDAHLPAIALIAYVVWFPVTMLTASGIAGVRVSYLDVARTLGAGRAYLIWHVALPAALPHIFIVLFIGLVASFLTLIVAETVGVQAGLGWYVRWRQGAGMEYANVYAALLIMIEFFSGLMTLLFRIRDRVLRWQKGIIQW
jgi:NitT/TauT family transport system permease protein